MSELQSTGEILRESIYRWLCREFLKIEESVNAETRVELDGVLWKLSEVLARAGLYESLKLHVAGFAEFEKRYGIAGGAR